jgi:DNA polymerase I - 3''-5'' exonuclease and polymerase domains
MMGVELGLAEEAQDLLFKKYPLVKEYHQKTWEDYTKYGYIENLNGRRIGGVLSWNQVINLPIQSCGSDMTTESGARLCKTALKTGNLNLLPRINIHDDNTFNMEEKTLEENIRLAAQEMVKASPLDDCRFWCGSFRRKKLVRNEEIHARRKRNHQNIGCISQF